MDKVFNFDKSHKNLEENGGYLILLNGEISAKKGNISHSDSLDIFHSLSMFLTFLNGKRTAPLFKHGIFQDNIIWTDYNSGHVDLHKNYHSWLHDYSSIRHIPQLWKNFSILWNKDNSFLKTAIHWYIESNKGSGFTEGALIMAQTGLELLYNYYVVEKKKIILGPDSENISAANKIRLLLSVLSIDSSAPLLFSELNDFIKESTQTKLNDAPEAAVQIRNAIVHSQEEKRKKLDKIDLMAKHESLQLCLWYIEMALLKILDYNGSYINRCSKQEESMPWNIT